LDSQYVFAKKGLLLEEAVRVPLIVSWPEGGIPTGMTIREPVSQIDIFPTILDYLQVPAQYDNSDGQSLRRHIEQKDYNRNFDDGAVVAEIEKVGKR